MTGREKFKVICDTFDEAKKLVEQSFKADSIDDVEAFIKGCCMIDWCGHATTQHMLGGYFDVAGPAKNLILYSKTMEVAKDLATTVFPNKFK